VHIYKLLPSNGIISILYGSVDANSRNIPFLPTILPFQFLASFSLFFFCLYVFHCLIVSNSFLQNHYYREQHVDLYKITYAEWWYLVRCFIEYLCLWLKWFLTAFSRWFSLTLAAHLRLSENLMWVFCFCSVSAWSVRRIFHFLGHECSTFYFMYTSRMIIQTAE
jgi:hypothetical protein